jgi:hypothetical protein
MEGDAMLRGAVPSIDRRGIPQGLPALQNGLASNPEVGDAVGISVSLTV